MLSGSRRFSCRRIIILKALTLAYAKGDYDEEVQINANGVPGLFANPQEAAANWLPMLPGAALTKPVRPDPGNE